MSFAKGRYSFARLPLCRFFRLRGFICRFGKNGNLRVCDAQSIGLELDSEAVSCWDNPIIASANSKYLERDLCGMLDKYSRDVDITAVWIWAEPRTDTSWDIYMEQRKIIQNATRRNKLKSGGSDVNETIEAEGNLQDVIELLANLRKNREPLLHCSVFIELKARNMDALKELQSEIAMELTRSKISVDRLTLRQKEGFLSVLPVGANQFGAQYERVLPASSVANLYPFNFSGKTDPQGLYIGRDKFGTNILVDFDRRAEDKTTSNILILGNSGLGKSYLLKLILTNIRESGKRVLCLDPESEYEEICESLGGCYIDFLSGQYTINPLEPKAWNDGQAEPALNSRNADSYSSNADARVEDGYVPEAFRRVTRLSQHIAFLKDFFRSYKDFSDTQIDTIEILLSKLYARFGITDSTDYSTKSPSDFPIMEDFYKLCEEEFMTYDRGRKYLYTEETLQEVCLGIHSMCVGAESKYFNGHTNITDSDFLVFGVKGLLDTNKRLKDAMLFNILSFMSNQLLGKGNTAASIDELYLFLTNMTAIEYIRNAMKRVRKKDSSIILASQNIEDFLIPSIREFTKPLFSMMKDNPNIRSVYLCLDNDEPGQAAAKRISDKLFTHGISHEIVIPFHKDWNDDLIFSEQEEPKRCQTLQLSSL